MKRSSDLLGLPVVSITDGAEIGKVKEIILNPTKAEIMGLVVQDDCWWKEARVVSFALIYGIGEYAATIENTSALAGISSMPDYESHLLKKIHARGSQVITRSGRLIGTVTEYFVDTTTGKIEGYEIQPSFDLQTSALILKLPSSCVLTLGKNIVVVSEDVEDHLTEADIVTTGGNAFGGDESVQRTLSASPVYDTASFPSVDETPEVAAFTSESFAQETAKDESLFEKIDVPELEIPEKIAPAEELLELTPPALQEEKTEAPVIQPQPSAQAVTPVTEPAGTVVEEPAKKGADLSKIFEERQKKFLLGKKTSRSIEAADGTLIAGEGEIITEDVIARAKTHGKFMELSISVKME